MAEIQHDEDERERGKILALIEKATNSTEREIDHRLLKAIKRVVRYSDLELKLAAQTLMQLMKRPHSQIRYLALLIIDELFMRSKLFRTLITENFDQLLSFSVGFRRTQPLPAPPAVATVLRLKAIEFLEKWNNSFGVHYRQIRLGYEYLKNTLRYQFPNLQANAARVEQETREREAKTQEILRNKFESLRESLPTIREEIKVSIDEIGECMKIAKAVNEGVNGVPLDDDDEEDEYDFRNSELRQIRLNSLKEAEKVHENNENKVVFDALREFYKLLVSNHLVAVQQWTSVLVRVEVEDNRFRDSALKELIDLRNQILAAKKKCEESGCVLDKRENEDDEIWEEGTSGCVEKSKVLGDVVHVTSVSSEDTPDRSIKGGSRRNTVNSKKDYGKAKMCSVDSNSLKGKLLAEAPVVKWCSALDNWGEKRDALANQRGLELDGHWGRVDYDATIPAEKIAELNVHASLYNEEQPEIQPCRAPLRKGGLCMRKDLRVCPFHGPIVPRDDEGNPIYHRDKGTSSGMLDQDSLSVRDNDEMDTNRKNILMEQLAEQALKNVRERDKEEAMKKEADKRAKKVKLVKVREHNDAVLREAAMASSSTYAGYGEYEGGATGERSAIHKKPTLASMLRKKVTAKDRLSQKLLNTRARSATVKLLTQGEDAKYRESFPNQW